MGWQFAFVSKAAALNVKDYGATGDGSTDDTASIQDAIDAVSVGQDVVYVPAGVYMVDASLASSIRLQSNMTLVIDPGATLRAIPNSDEEYHVILISGKTNVKIVGGTVQGERSGHLGSTGQWGHGLWIENSNGITVEGTTFKDMWGDGMYISGCIGGGWYNVKSDNNRRQGLSIVSASNLFFEACTFNGTNGSSPQSGIDLEPNLSSDIITNIRFIGCTITDNLGRGLLTWGSNGPVSDVHLETCVIHDNQGEVDWNNFNLGYKGITIDGCTITANNRYCINLSDTDDNTIINNTLTIIESAYAWIDGSGGSGNVIANNTEL